MWSQLLRRMPQGGISLQAQIRQMLVSAVLDGQLPVGAPIPSSRELADQLGVARNTVVLAYQQLVDEGLLVARQRSGFYVNPQALQGRVWRSGPEPKAAAAAIDWSRRFRFVPSAQRNIVKRSDWQNCPYPFLYGQFDPSLFPTADWRECCQKALSVLDIRDWAPDLILRDDTSLVRQVQSRVLPRRGVFATPDEIVVTVGVQQALYLLADLLVTSDTVVGMEDPGYPDARNTFASRSARIVPLPVDEDGLVPDDLAAHGCDYVYVTPSHQCPTTVTMPLARREALLAAVEASDAIVIEDDYESENRFEGDATPALKSLDRHDRVIYVGSLSKTFAPGLRAGYVVGPAELIRELRALRRLSLRHPSSYIQRAFALFLSLGHYDALLLRLSAEYRARAAALSAALAAHLPDVRFVPIEGGASCWVVGPPWLDATELGRNAELQGVLIEPGEVFFMSEATGRNTFRLGYTSIPVARIEPGIRVLGELMRKMTGDATRAA